MNDDRLLRRPDVFPTPEILEGALGDIYPVLSEFLSTVESDRFSFTPEWRYYKDGGGWLCKVTLKKKTVAWLSFWTRHIKVAFYFTEKSGGGIGTLKIRASLKRAYADHAPSGRLKPLIAEIRRMSELRDVYTLLEYKAANI
ncbi:MAG TPA: DUF3788 family protein [Verrucomicrobiota bacterium]|nr:DUF3788 family protein [Verrucomicrobiota bacterium]